MIGIYFTGTGNSKYCVYKFLEEYGGNSPAFSIEQDEAVTHIKNNSEIVISYPVQFSNIPKILHDYITANQQLWNGKKIFIIATMGLFSGDGSGILARLLKKYGAVIIGGLHLKLPDSISDEKALKRNYEKNLELVRNAETKIRKAVKQIKSGKPPQEGLGILYHTAGLFGQRLYFYNKTKHYTDKLKINPEKCIRCGLCERLCPMRNIKLTNDIAVAKNKCTMCYRCINNCPKQAITLLGKAVIEQHDINKYL
ncbi:MAG: 4Fe-4S dicluster domain-containing protein [Lachnospiraceae bacterium]|nr:4Fe-4S dicluster domain-containing protein [Lachnospiraceae bacterium]